MTAKKNPVPTPLHLLQQLSHSLVAHLQKACDDAQKDAQILLAKLEKQRGKTQEKLIKARAKLDDAGNTGKSKAQTKARSKLTELDDMLAVLQSRQSETLSYLAELKRDAEQSLNLAQGVTQVEKAAAQALASREKSAPSRAATTRGKAPVSASKPATKAASVKKADTRANAGSATTTPRPAASQAKPSAAKNSAAAKQGEARAPSTKAAATRAPSASRRAANGKTAPAAKPTSTATKPAAAKKPAARKPATVKGEALTQSAPTAS